MRLDSVRMRGLGPFRDEVKLDMGDLGDAMLVAVCGDNGEGKSTFLEFAIPGAFYRQTPKQGSLRDRALARDSLLEVGVTGTASYTIRHLVDGVSGKGESVVLDRAGKPLSGSTKVSDFDVWAARNLPLQEVLLASMFRAQKDDGFLGASPGERKGILLRALGIARYEAWSAGAGERARASKQQLEVTRARLDETRRRGGSVAETSAALEVAKREAVRLDGELDSSRAALALQEGQVREAEIGAAAHATYVTKHADLKARISTLAAKRDEIAQRIAACNKVLGQEAAIRDAAAKLDGIRQRNEELIQQEASHKSRQEVATQRRRNASAQADEARRHQARVSLRIADLRQLIDQGAEIAKAEAELRGVEAGLGALREGVKSAQAALDELSNAAVANAEGRVKGLRDGLTVVAREVQTLDAARDVAETCLSTDYAAAREASERPAKLGAARKALATRQETLADVEKRQQALSALARRAGEVAAARSQMASLTAEFEQHTESLRRHEAEANEAAAYLRSLADLLKDIGESKRELNEQADKLKPLADQLPNIALATSRLEERKVQQQEVAGELEAAQWALSELGPAPAPVVVPDVAGQRSKVVELERAARAAHQAVAVAESKLEAARAVDQQVLALEEQVRSEETELTDWTRLAADLGRQGLQAAEIDGAGPELTALVNDLLHRCHGPRWTVRIDTQVSSADGRRTLEGCRVTVIDTVTGREDEGSKFSGGEQVIIGEALTLGLSMLACQRSGLRGVTLVRDETGAALDPSNGEVYVKMLRRAAEQIGADRVLFVCHNPAVSELADARITVAGGRLQIDAQAGRVAA